MDNQHRWQCRAKSASNLGISWTTKFIGIVWSHRPVNRFEHKYCDSASLKSSRSAFSQWSGWRSGVMWSNLDDEQTSQAAAWPIQTPNNIMKQSWWDPRIRKVSIPNFYFFVLAISIKLYSALARPEFSCITIIYIYNNDTNTQLLSNKIQNT